MGRQPNKLHFRQIARLAAPGRYSDGAGLYFKIDKSGARRWVFLYMRGGRAREAGLGSANAVTLAAARDMAAECRALLAEGKDPIDARRASRAPAKRRRTFGECADKLIASKRSEWRNAKHAEQWRSSLGTPCAAIRDMPVDLVDTAAVRAVLDPLWSKVPETASRLRARIEQVLAAAAVEGLRSRENPASWRNHLALVYPRRQTLSRKHHPAMAYAELPNFVAKLRATDTVAARTLTLIILCALRLDEVRSAPWGEFDLPSAIWTIPAERMKGGVVHRVPLTTMTLEIIGPQGQGYVFPGRNPRRPISEGAIRAYIPSGATIHGMRSAFSDWAHDQGFVYEVVEAALAHKTGTAVSRAYRRGDALELRRGLMEAWANFLL